jgi:hypothetical protein
MPAARPTADQPLRFHIAALVAAGCLWIEDLGDLPLSQEQWQLVAAIARALTHPRRSVDEPRVAQFDWPLHRNPQLALDADEASAALHSFLERQIDDAGCRALLCCGDAARERIVAQRFTVPVIDLPSTREVLQDPALKPVVWRSLRRQLPP